VLASGFTRRMISLRLGGAKVSRIGQLHW